MWHIHFLPSSTASYPARQFQLPPGSSQTNETFWSKEQVCSPKEAFWGLSVATWEFCLWSQAAPDQNPDLSITGCLS